MLVPPLEVGPGAPAPARLHEMWPHAGYYDAYGLTKCQGIATFLHAHESIRKIGCVGKPALMREVMVVDEESRPLPASVPGEICVRGPLVTPGYWRDDATKLALAGRWLHTGDVGYFDGQGDLHVVDRLKDMIRSGLENVASSEVERVVHELPDVAEATVIAMPDDRRGEVPVAFVVCRPGRGLTQHGVVGPPGGPRAVTRSEEVRPSAVHTHAERSRMFFPRRCGRSSSRLGR